MKFQETRVAGVRLIELEPIEDSRGAFMRTFCRETFQRHGLEADLEQCNLVVNHETGTLRGMHYQVAPHAEVKVVHCLAGAMHDVVIDLREDSPTYGQHAAHELSGDHPALLYIPAGFAHGYQALQDHTVVYYFMSAAYAPEAARTIRWNDPAFAIDWPIPEPIVLDRDRGHPDFRPSR